VKRQSGVDLGCVESVGAQFAGCVKDLVGWPARSRAAAFPVDYEEYARGRTSSTMTGSGDCCSARRRTAGAFVSSEAASGTRDRARSAFSVAAPGVAFREAHLSEAGARCRRTAITPLGLCWPYP